MKFQNTSETAHCFHFSCISIFHYLYISEDSLPAPDEVSMLTAIALFLWSASSEIIGVQSLQNGCMNRFKKALNSCDPWVSYTYNKHRSKHTTISGKLQIDSLKCVIHEMKT